ncbi:NUDIX hydrolase N-terminal domain-containing protein [Halococcus agarilyticus]|uniref:NUDIX hydrolase N-terminal domain-containing protein n=1 Tax=Halococcus agarilyticus TaxID=1232219 RepID=UPI000A785C45|nr:NUDIX hydrolase N-terminal domain-containing protein [Halococcus agarilyticus]
MTDDSVDILPLLDELRVMAQNGLFFADDPYDRERYERMLELVSEYYGETLDCPPADVHDRLARDLGYVTPHIGAKAAIFDDGGRILLMKRPDDGPVAGTWDIPGGAVEPYESPATAATREACEETGLDVETVDIVDGYPMEPNELNPHGHVGLVYLCEPVGGTLELSHEGEALEYWEVEDVPAWTLDFADPALDARELWRDRQNGTG